MDTNQKLTPVSAPNLGRLEANRPTRERVAHPEVQHLAFDTHPDAPAFGPTLKAGLGYFRLATPKVAAALRQIGYYDIPKEVMTAMRQKPRGIDPHLWARIQQFVEDAVSVTTPLTGYTATMTRGVVARYVEWVVITRRLPLDADLIWTREMIDLFSQDTTINLAPGTLAWYRVQLNRINKILSPEPLPYEYKPVQYRKSSRAPYTEQEIANYRDWVNGLTNPKYRRQGVVMMSLCAGAGLHSTEVGQVTPNDVTVSDSGILIKVHGTRPRLVPLVQEWEPWLIAAVETTLPGCTLWGDDGRKDRSGILAAFTEKAETVSRRLNSTERMRADRLRNTWIVWHLNQRTPLKDLFIAAGVKKMENLWRHLEHCDPLPTDEYLHVLSGRSSK